jgi:hypothetical protein
MNSEFKESKELEQPFASPALVLAGHHQNTIFDSLTIKWMELTGTRLMPT